MGRIVVDIANAVAAVTISAPPMNALDAAMRTDLVEQLERLERDGAVRAIMLRGDGPKAFCAGFDIGEITASLGSAERTLAQFQSDAVLFDRISQCPKPTLAMVEGVALGVVLGFVGALAVTRLIGTLLYDVSPIDPVSFATVSALLLAVGIVASYVPARRASKVDPLVALRTD